MRVTKTQIINGATAYIESDVIPAIPDKGFQVILSIGVNAVKSNNHLLDNIFGNDIVKTVSEYNDEDKTYDVDAIAKLMKEGIEKVGYFPVKIPAINFISPVEKEIKFSASDVDKLRNYIVG